MNKVQLLLKNPFFVFSMLFDFGNMGLYTSFTFFYFQNYIQDNYIELIPIYLGIFLTYFYGLLYGINISKKYVRILMYICCIVQTITFPLIFFFYDSNVQLTVIILMITGFFSSYIGIYLLPKVNRNKNFEKRFQQNTQVWGLLYAGMLVFTILLLVDLLLAFFLGFFSSIIGSIGLYQLLKSDIGEYTNYTKLSLKEIFKFDYLAYLVLFFIYFYFFFTMISILAFSPFFISFFPENSFTMILVPLFLTNTLFPFLITKINKRFTLKNISTLTYVIGSISLILIYNDPSYLIFAYIGELWTWSIFSIYIFVNIADSFPGLKNIQPLNFFWLLLPLSVGIGILTPLIITDMNVLLPFLLLLMLLSIVLFSFLKTIKQPCKVFLLIIQSKSGLTLFEQGFYDVNIELFQGVFDATNILFKESFKSLNTLRSIEYENKTLMLTESDLLYSVIIGDKYDKSAIRSLREITNLFEVSFYTKIKNLNNNHKEVVFQSFTLKDLPEILKRKILLLESV